jgi:hypothetical protein
MYECPTCGKPTSSTKQCRNCGGKLNEYWVKVVADLDRQDENAARNRRRKEECFTDHLRLVNGKILDGWDTIYDGDDYKEWDEYDYAVELLLPWISEVGILTKGELSALEALFSTPNPARASADEVAEILSRRERKSVSADAYRRRLSNLREKLGYAAEVMYEMWLNEDEDEESAD